MLQKWPQVTCTYSSCFISLNPSHTLLYLCSSSSFAGGRPSRIAGRKKPSQSPSMWLLGRTYMRKGDEDDEEGKKSFDLTQQNKNTTSVSAVAKAS